MNIVVVGAQWGDEGKGKMVDYLAEEADIVVRYSGGANAGHTIIVGEKVYKLHLVPSGIVSPGKISVLGMGMVIDLEALFLELEELETAGLDWKGRVFISDRAHLVLPAYKPMDLDLESRRRFPIGTTGRGIGISYAMKAQRDGLRIGDLFSSVVWDALTANEKTYFERFKERIRPMVLDMAQFMSQNKGKKTLFEGAQGILLDLDIGTYPFVSSGVSAAAGASLGGGVGPRHLDKIYGVFKAYSTRVGNGPFPSEFKSDRDGDLGPRIQKIGKEVGVTTGRSRRCGYLDLVALKYACWTNSLDALIMTKLDVYDGFENLSVCTGYEHEGQILTSFPSSIQILEGAKPIIKSFEGWKGTVSTCKDFKDLPKQAQIYLDFIEEYTSTSIEILSVGPDRSQTFMRAPLWTK